MAEKRTLSSFVDSRSILAFPLTLQYTPVRYILETVILGTKKVVICADG